MTPKIGEVKPEQEVHVRHILVETEAEAKEVAERLKKGEDFAAVAKEKSKDSGAEGGDLGFVGPGEMLKPVEDAAFALEVGADLGSGPDAVRLAHLQGRGKAQSAAADLRPGQGGDRRPVRAGQGASRW